MLDQVDEPACALFTTSFAVELKKVPNPFPFFDITRGY